MFYPLLAGTPEFVAQARIWLRRFGGNLYNNLPYALSGLAAWDSIGSFGPRFEALKNYVEVINSAAEKTGASGSVSFNQGVQCSMVHCHLRVSVEGLKDAIAVTAAETGVTVCSRVRVSAVTILSFLDHHDDNYTPI